MDAVLCAVPCGQKRFILLKTKQKKPPSEPASSDADHELQLAITELTKH